MRAAFVALATALFCSNATAQCTKDVECKGDRICVQGACVDAPAKELKPAATSASAPALAPAAPAVNPYSSYRRTATTLAVAAWGATALGAAAMGDVCVATTIIPVVGPFISMIRISSDPKLAFLPGGEPLLLGAGLIQAGLVTWAFAASAKESEFERRLTIGPGPTLLGASAAIRF